MCSAPTRWPKPTPQSRRRWRTARTGGSVPFVTIDPPDAKDHDDAVHAEPDTAANNRGGFIVSVAIADVAHYVTPGSALDREALGARQFGLFPRPRGADAAGAHFQRSVLAASARGPRRACRAHGDRRRRPQALAHLPPRHDALGRQAVLPTGAIRHRRAHRRGHRAAGRAGARRRSTPPTRRSSARAANAGRSISICRNARSCSKPTAPSTA